MCETTFPLDEAGRLQSQDGSAVKQGLRTGAFAEYVVVDESQVVVNSQGNLPFDSASTALLRRDHRPRRRDQYRQGALGQQRGRDRHRRRRAEQRAGRRPLRRAARDRPGHLRCQARSRPGFGATDTVNPSKEDAREAVRALTNGRGADYVFVTVGSTKAIEQGLGLLRKVGTLVIVGMPPEGSKAAIEALDLADQGQRILGSKMGNTRLRVDIPKLVDLYQQGRLKLDELVSNRYPIEQINEAIASVKQTEALRNVIVFED